MIVETFLDYICEINLEDDVTFSFKKIDKIREGDKITPKEINYEFKLLLEDRRIKILAYNLEIFMAEKLETIISRGNQNTRPRDFYDVLKYANYQVNMPIEKIK